jgi:hypothetical protein
LVALSSTDISCLPTSTPSPSPSPDWHAPESFSDSSGCSSFDQLVQLNATAERLRVSVLLGLGLVLMLTAGILVVSVQGMR